MSKRTQRPEGGSVKRTDPKRSASSKRATLERKALRRVKYGMGA